MTQVVEKKVGGDIGFKPGTSAAYRKHRNRDSQGAGCKDEAGYVSMI